MIVDVVVVVGVTVVGEWTNGTNSGVLLDPDANTTTNTTTTMTTFTAEESRFLDEN